MQSAVRLPTPPPLGIYPTHSNLGRKRSPPSRSPSPTRRPSPPQASAPSAHKINDVNPQRATEWDHRLAERTRKQGSKPTKPPTEEEKQAAAKAEYEKLLNSRSGGTYIPPARLKALQSQITDKTSKEYQRMAWEALKKSINGLINKVNVSNIKFIVPELFTENLVRGRGLFCRSIMKAAASSSAFVAIYAAMAAIINTKLPQVGELLVHRLIVQFKKAFKRNDKAVCLSSTTFIAHLVNQQVVHEILAAQILLLLLNKPTDDGVEIAVGLTREVGQHLEEMSGPIALAVFDQFRSILHEQDLDKRVQYMIEVLFQVRKDKYKDNPAVKDELDLVEEEDQITHRASLDDEIDVQDGLNVFKFDAQWEEHEEAYKKLKAEILGEAEGSDDEEYESGESSDDEEAQGEKELEIKDQTNADLTNLRRTIYLTIMSSLDFEEAVHKLLKVNLPVGQEPELPSMVVECCSQERTYSKFYGLIGERFAKLNRLWTELFETSFAKYYETIHRYETNRLRNIARFFGHLLSSDAIGWHVLSVVHLNEEETTSSSRIFIKILFQDLAEALGMAKLQARLKDDILRASYEGIFPTDNARNTRFSINYFTSIGMGALTEAMREQLKNAPKPAAIMPIKAESESDSESSVSSYSSYSGSSSSYSRSRTPSRSRALQASPPPLLNDVSSPLLAALGTYHTTENISQPVYPGLEWAEDISSHSTPPIEQQFNGFSLAGSPPNRRQQARKPSADFSNASPAPSPPNMYPRPTRRTSGYQSLGGYMSSSPGAERPMSKQSHRSPTQNPALPHHAQAHFYTAPEVDFGMPQSRQTGAGSPAPSCFVFDDLGLAGAEGLRGPETALLVGLENRLEVLKVNEARLELIGRLENLRGVVVGAQLLPSSTRVDPARSSRPLVAVVVNGPQREQRRASHERAGENDDDALFDPSGSMLQALEHRDQTDQVSGTQYETTVEIHSLVKSEHIATLLRCPINAPMVFNDASRPAVRPPEGGWQLKVCGRFLAVTSGKSGEVFVFETHYGLDNGPPLAFTCIGKTWTSIVQRKTRSLSTSSTESEKNELDDVSVSALGKSSGAILSLSHRWLAVVPPSMSTKTTMHASVDLQRSYEKPPGLSSHTSPPSPQPTCDLDTPEKESVLNKVARDVTQEFMKGARWVGDQGLQAWKNYWLKPPDQQTPAGPRSLPGNTSLPPRAQQSLPPTHANDDAASRNTNQRALVSILDLERLSASQAMKEDVALHPMATFPLPDGCSLVSFTPNGLGLFTASAKGDIQHVWSLMRMAHSHVEKGPSVRQIARFTRLTVANIVDVAWPEPGGERLALVTERGTLHIFDLPPSALQWPPPRRIARPSPASTTSPGPSPELEVAVPYNPPSNRFSSAMDLVTGRTQPLLAAVRGRPANIGNPFSGFSGMSITAGAGIKGGKVVAAGFNRSVGAATGTVNTLRHLGENRLALPGPAHAVKPGRVRWLTGRNRGAIAVVGGDLVRIHRIGHSRNQKPGKRRPSAVGSKPIELSFTHPLSVPATGKQGYGRGKGQADRTSPALRGFWQAFPARPMQRVENDSLHSQAEIDTNAPYQPFHTDRRVSMYVYADESIPLDGYGFEESTPWVFGEGIATVRTSAGAAVSRDGSETEIGQQGPMENHVSVQGNEKEGQQIVITTRRRKAPKAEAGEGGDEEIFEDECEVVDFADERV
ncbi:MAG: hypothetical protein Q9185_005038 [Variospora sp. 1 TL-2023]